MKSKKRTVLDGMIDEFITADPKRNAMWDQAGMEMQVAQLIYDMRTAAKLSERELANRVGTTASVICRLEQADSGHSLQMLYRIGQALGQRIVIQSIPESP